MVVLAMLMIMVTRKHMSCLFQVLPSLPTSKRSQVETLQRKMAEGEISSIAKLSGAIAGVKDIDIKVSSFPSLIPCSLHRLVAQICIALSIESHCSFHHVWCLRFVKMNRIAFFISLQTFHYFFPFLRYIFS